MPEEAKLVVIDLNPERRAKFERLMGEILDICKRELTPIEACAMLTMMTDVLKDLHDIREMQELKMPTEMKQ